MSKTKTKDIRSKKVSDGVQGNSFIAPLLWVLALCAMTWLVYSASTRFDLTNWDEKHYIHEQSMTRGLNAHNMEQMFTRKVLGSYNPLVLLSFAIDYEIAKTKAPWYHKVNLFFHILNTLLLFALVRKLGFRIMIAGFIALLFAIHPMHVESVAWVASRKDVLMAFFMFSSWWFYLHYREKNNWVFIVISILLFILALLSKAQAVTLPLILILSDYLKDKSFKPASLLNKIPFFVFAIGFGLYAVSGSTLAADKYAVPLSFIEKVLYSFMALWIYLYKAILPVHQSAIYAFPEKSSQEFMVLLVLGISSLLAMTYLVIRYYKKNTLLVFSILFFLVNTFLTLHLVAVNSSLIYERFTYISYIGLFFLIALPEEKWKSGKQMLWIMAGVCIVFAYASSERLKVWKNSVSLWTDVIEKNPGSNVAYNNRGDFYSSSGQLDLAFQDFNNSIRVNPLQPNALNNLAVIWFKRNELDKALVENQKALDLDPEYAQATSNRGILFYNKGMLDSAIYYYEKAIGILPRYAFAFCNLGSAYLKKEMYDEAIKHYKRALELQPDYADASKYLGLAYLKKEQYEDAEKAMFNAQKMNPSGDAVKTLSSEYLLLGSNAFHGGDTDKAIFFCQKAIHILPMNAEAYYNMGGYYMTKKDLARTREYWKKALEINPNHKDAKEWLQRIGS